MNSVNIETPGDVNITGDIAGRDKITHHHHYGEKKERPAPRMAPPAPRVLVGRDEVLRELIAALKLGEDGAGPIALTALKGMGGIGKTTLAAALANHPEVETALPEGTLWAGLGPEPEVMSLLAEWGTQLGEDFAQFDSPEVRSRRLSTLLHDKKALLIVDDVWHAEPARYFLVGGPHCRALITTRDNEIARKLAGHEAIRVETLTDAASLNLLRNLAPKAVSADEKAANELATILDGLPLAITLAGQMLAAEWEAGLGVAGALSELKDREARLKLVGAEKRAGLQTTEPSFGAILAMSYDHLTDEATKRTFRLLGVFGAKPLTFSIEAAAAIWGIEPRPAQKTMVALVGRALVEPVESGRYTLHTTLADFAESLLEEHGEATLARETHANYYLEFARKNAEKNWQAVEDEMGQIRSGFEWTASISTDKQMVLDYFSTMDAFLHQRGLWDDQMKWAEAALPVIREMGNREDEGNQILHIGGIYHKKGDWDKALEYYDRSRAIYEEIGDRAGLASALYEIGRIYYNKGVWEQALKYIERSQAICEEIGNQDVLAELLQLLGDICKYKGMFDQALEYYKQSLKISEELGQLGLWQLEDIGLVYGRKGMWDEALKYYDRCRIIWEEIGGREGMAGIYTTLGIAYATKGMLEQGLEFCERSRAIYEEIGSRLGLGEVFCDLGDIYCFKEMWGTALEHYECSRAIFEEMGARPKLAKTLRHMAEAYESQGRLADAEQVLTQAVVTFEALGMSDLDNARKQLDKIRELQQTASQK